MKTLAIELVLTDAPLRQEEAAQGLVVCESCGGAFHQSDLGASHDIEDGVWLCWECGAAASDGVARVSP